MMRIGIKQQYHIYAYRFIDKSPIAIDIHAPLPVAVTGKGVIVQEGVSRVSQEEIDSVSDSAANRLRKPCKFLFEFGMARDLHGL
ncbi:MAG TPA: hypothetical protein VHO23_01850 [Candidatus Paceibacterota bacterium]|nr:hypothetical protein [Candidatus Paceibacterota bacterium]